MKSILKIFFVVTFILSVYIFIIAISAYIDWEINKDRLLSNLDEYYHTIKNAKYTKREYVILDEEGKIIEAIPTRIYDRNYNLIGEFTPSKRKIIQLEDVPETLIRSLILIEDKNFYKHCGINIKGIIRAAIKNIISFKIVEGGSSITQQLAKILFTSRKKTLYRKFLELYGALSIEKRFTKNDILLMYINTVYFGHGTYGIKSAAELYFNKNVKSLNIFEISLLISIIPSPNYYSPYNNPEISKKKHFIILSRLAKFGLISRKNLKKRFKNFWRKYQNRMKLPNVSFWKMRINRAPYVIEYIRQELLKHFTPAEILQGGLKVYTTVDIEIQNLLRDTAKKYLKEFINTKTNASYYKDLQCAILVMEPKSGDVLGFIGGRNFTFDNQLNRAFNIRRQVGSTIKPLIYTTAIDTKIVTSVTFFTDRIIVYNDKGKRWAPKNYDNIYRGRVLLKDGLIQSINTVSVQLLKLITPEYFVSHTMQRIFSDLDISPKFLPVLSLALGTVEMSPYEVAISYSVIANGGKKVYPLIIRKICNKFGKYIFDYENNRISITNKWKEEGECQIFSRGATFVISYILKNVFKEGGTGFYAAKKVGLKVQIAGKTGTTTEFKDAWCTGFTPDFVITSWVGFDNFQKSLGYGATGGIVAGPIIVDLFNKIYWGKIMKDFPIPSNEVVFCDISRDTGKLATSSSTNIEYNVPFLTGTQPVEY